MKELEPVKADAAFDEDDVPHFADDDWRGISGQRFADPDAEGNARIDTLLARDRAAMNGRNANQRPRKPLKSSNHKPNSKGRLTWDLPKKSSETPKAAWR